MSFHPISTTTGSPYTWNLSGPGRYIRSDISFGSPLHYIRITGGKLQRDKRLGASIQHVIENDATINSETVRSRMVTNLNILVPTRDPYYTTTVVDNSVSLLAEFLTTANIDRWLKGEN